MKSPVAKVVTDLWTNLDVDLEAVDFERLVMAVERCAVALEAIADRDDPVSAQPAPAQHPSIPATWERDPALGFLNRVEQVRRERPELTSYGAVVVVRDAMRLEQNAALIARLPFNPAPAQLVPIYEYLTSRANPPATPAMVAMRREIERAPEAPREDDIPF